MTRIISPSIGLLIITNEQVVKITTVLCTTLFSAKIRLNSFVLRKEIM